ncbi:hypothetical protein pb186bvf_009728 [Paramecium bursaria]
MKNQSLFGFHFCLSNIYKQQQKYFKNQSIYIPTRQQIPVRCVIQAGFQSCLVFSDLDQYKQNEMFLIMLNRANNTLHFQPILFDEYCENYFCKMENNGILPQLKYYIKLLFLLSIHEFPQPQDLHSEPQDLLTSTLQAILRFENILNRIHFQVPISQRYQYQYQFPQCNNNFIVILNIQNIHQDLPIFRII